MYSVGGFISGTGDTDEVDTYPASKGKWVCWETGDTKT